MRHKYADWPECFFIELREGSNSPWTAFSRDNDEVVMRTRYDYQAEMLKPGGGVRMLDDTGTILHEKLA